MRRLEDHVVTGDTSRQLEVLVLDEPGAGGANHDYAIKGYGQHPDGFTENGFPTSFVDCKISFQNGPIREVGVNGLTQEVLLAVLIDRLRSFQAGPFACTANAVALGHLKSALYCLQERTRDRIARGVEGLTKA